MKVKPTKYGNKAIVVDGQTFDSKKEYRRWQELKLLEKAGKITNLQRQKKYSLILSQYGRVPDPNRPGETKRVCLERECAYIADFVYKENEQLIVEDCKGVRTKDYIIKRKLMLHCYGIRIKET